MITYLQTSLFESPAQTVVNTVNTVGIMGKGIALSFKKLYPAMYEEYHRLCEMGKLDIGKLHVYRTPNKLILNFPTKKHWRNPSKLEYIEAGLKEFVLHYTALGISSVSFPQLGCGNGELNWDTQVSPLMEKRLRDLPIAVYIHLYKSTPTFVPERLDPAYSREVLLERQQVSTNQLWEDLRARVAASEQEAKILRPLWPKIWMDDDFIHFLPLSAEQPITLYRGTVDDVWHTLRLQGTVSCMDIPQVIKDCGAEDWLLDLLEQLDYVKPLRLKPLGAAQACRGLQYAPHPDFHAQDVIEIPA